MPLLRHAVPSLLVLLLLGGMLLACGCTSTKPAGAQANGSIAAVTFYTEQNPPFNYMENGTLQGIAVDLLEAVTERMGQKVSRDQVRLVPWPDGYQTVLTTNNTVLFTTVRLPGREESFRWVGPIYPYTNVLFAPRGSTITISGPADMNRYRIGVITDDIAAFQLRELDVDQSRFVQEANASALVAKLRNGEIDLWAYQELAGLYFAREILGDADAVTIVYTLPALDGYYAFNKGTPDATIRSFQQALDALKTEKDAAGVTAYERIVQRYVPSR